MTSTTRVTMTGALFAILFLAVSPTAGAQTGTQPARSATSSSAPQLAGQVRYIKASIIDDRLSALRREPGLQAMVIRRIRLGQTVYLVSANSAKACQTKFCRVAVTRRTRGWIHSSALAVQGRAGEDPAGLQRLAYHLDNAAARMRTEPDVVGVSGKDR